MRGFVEDRQVFGIDFDGDCLLATGIDLHLAPTDKALGRLLCTGWERRVDLRNLGSAACADVGYGECGLDGLSRSDGERRVAVSGV